VTRAGQAPPFVVMFQDRGRRGHEGPEGPAPLVYSANWEI